MNWTSPEMGSLFRYLDKKYVDSFLRGDLLFRALSYYRNYEEREVRGDVYEGAFVHEPIGGLKIRKNGHEEEITIPYKFESTVRENQIFVSCLSTKLEESLARKFKADACIEIVDTHELLRKVRKALAGMYSVKNKKLEHGEVAYYEESVSPGVTWALPERITFCKKALYGWQSEYRIAFAVKNAFDVENVDVKLVSVGSERQVEPGRYPKKILSLGSLNKICLVHRFD